MFRFATIAAFVLTSRVAAQEQTSVVGLVRDSVSRLPLIGAIVTLEVSSGQRTVRTDELGEFVFLRVPSGTGTLTVRRLGYEPVTRTIQIAGDRTEVPISLIRVAQLDTIRVRAARQAIYGAVGASRDLKPLTHAKLQILGPSGSGRASVDSTGHFFYPVRASGPYFVRATADGYMPNAVSITVPRDAGAEVSFLLDTTSGASHVIEHAFRDFHERMVRRTLYSAIIPRSELLSHETVSMLDAIRTSPSFTAKNLRFTYLACVFVDGRPRPGVSLNSIDPEDVEAVEVYAREPSLTLSQKWPQTARCGETGLPRGAPGTDLVRWVVFWLKQ